MRKPRLVPPEVIQQVQKYARDHLKIDGLPRLLHWDKHDWYFEVRSRNGRTESAKLRVSRSRPDWIYVTKFQPDEDAQKLERIRNKAVEYAKMSWKSEAASWPKKYRQDFWARATISGRKTKNEMTEWSVVVKTHTWDRRGAYLKILEDGPDLKVDDYTFTASMKSFRRPFEKALQPSSERVAIVQAYAEQALGIRGEPRLVKWNENDLYFAIQDAKGDQAQIRIDRRKGSYGISVVEFKPNAEPAKLETLRNSAVAFARRLWQIDESPSFKPWSKVVGRQSQPGSAPTWWVRITARTKDRKAIDLQLDDDFKVIGSREKEVTVDASKPWTKGRTRYVDFSGAKIEFDFDSRQFDR